MVRSPLLLALAGSLLCLTAHAQPAAKAKTPPATPVVQPFAPTASDAAEEVPSAQASPEATPGSQPAAKPTEEAQPAAPVKSPARPGKQR